MAMEKQCRVIVWRDGDAFTSRIDGTDISSYGETAEEAFANLKKSASLYFEEMTEEERAEVFDSAQEVMGDNAVEVRPLSLTIHNYS